MHAHNDSYAKEQKHMLMMLLVHSVQTTRMQQAMHAVKQSIDQEAKNYEPVPGRILLIKE